ncbi:MAG: hypothetical protein KJ757_07595 [Planctomycetes bacterium]|nr:hypothetical protein [Planctomycetota bacterium]
MNLFVAGLRQTKATLSIDKADLSSLPANKSLLLAAQKQLLELLINDDPEKGFSRFEKFGLPYKEYLDNAASGKK